MAKEFKDFTFMGKKLSDLSVKYVSVDFDDDADAVSYTHLITSK